MEEQKTKDAPKDSVDAVLDYLRNSSTLKCSPAVDP